VEQTKQIELTQPVPGWLSKKCHPLHSWLLCRPRNQLLSPEKQIVTPKQSINPTRTDQHQLNHIPNTIQAPTIAARSNLNQINSLQCSTLKTRSWGSSWVRMGLVLK
jgi:hypothetical protein